MVLPMIVPLLGAAFGGRFLAERMENWEEERDQTRMGQKISGILEPLRDEEGNLPGPDAQAEALVRGGLLSPSQYMDSGFSEFDRAANANAQYDLWGRQQDNLRAFDDQVRAQRDRANAEFLASVGMNEAMPADIRADAVARLGQYKVDEFARRTGLLPTEPAQLPDLGEYGPGIPGGDLQTAASVVGQLEGGRYDALGPLIDNPSSRYHGDRAYGKYQVMGRNIPQWTREVLGQEMTPAEFTRDPAAQDAVFEAKFGQNLARYGMADALSIWHSGQRLQDAARRGANDGYTGTVDYVRRGTSLYAGALQGQDREVAAELAGMDAAQPYADSLSSVDSVLSGLRTLPRVPGQNWGNTADQATADQVRKDATALRYAWQEEVYGDREPTPVVQDELKEVFGTPEGMFANRARSANLFRLMQAELQAKQRYDMVRARVEAGDRSLLPQLRELNGGQLTREQRNAILRNRDPLPEGLAEGEAPRSGESGGASSGIAGTGRVGKYDR